MLGAAVVASESQGGSKNPGGAIGVEPMDECLLWSHALVIWGPSSPFCSSWQLMAGMGGEVWAEVMGTFCSLQGAQAWLVLGDCTQQTRLCWDQCKALCTLSALSFFLVVTRKMYFCTELVSTVAHSTSMG